VTCPSCASRLRVSDDSLGKRVKCPRCSGAFPVQREEDSPEAPEPETRVADQPAITARRRRPAEEEPVASVRRSRREENPEGVQEAPDDTNEPPAETPRKKKRKKKRRRIRHEESESPAWLWWTFGGGGIFLVMAILLVVALVTHRDNPVKACAIYLLIAMPVSTVIFFVAMFLSSIWFGAIEIGEIHVAVVKSFALLLVVNLVTLLPLGGYLALAVWLVGLIGLFRLDLWEARMLIFVNWVLNFLLRSFVFTALLSWAAHGGGGKNAPNSSGPTAAWDAEDVQERGGDLQYDFTNPNDPAVVGITLRGPDITDAEVAHLADFPRLTRLDLGNTSISDAGLARLKACKSLQTLFLRGTRVTDEGVRDLQQALPRLQVVR
jgi:predicted Zn finger-like uncharacterized protein